MSTRSHIGIKNQDGSITSIYCHSDGYPDYVGAVLQEHYTTEAKVRELLALGDLSSLGERVAPEPGEAHSFDAPAKGVTVAYGRDRGEKGVDAYTHSDTEWPDSGQEYEYTFDPVKGTWRTR